MRQRVTSRFNWTLQHGYSEETKLRERKEIGIFTFPLGLAECSDGSFFCFGNRVVKYQYLQTYDGQLKQILLASSVDATYFSRIVRSQAHDGNTLSSIGEANKISRGS